MQMKSTDRDHKIYIGVEWFEPLPFVHKKNRRARVNVYKEQVHI